MITLIDYQKGNLQSVTQALVQVGAEVEITSDPEQVAGSDVLVLPGVGAFGDAMGTLHESGLDRALMSAIERGAAFLGICLGLQLMYEWGEEGSQGHGHIPGLGLLKGTVTAMPDHDMEGNRYKIPHVGWNNVHPLHRHPLFNGIEDQSYFYFTHSYQAPDGPGTLSTTTHSVTFPSAAFVRENVVGVQFHPEKSSDLGLKLLSNFVSMTS